METKVDEMHAVLMQARGVRWAVIAFAALIGFLIGVGTFLIQIGKFRLAIIGILFLVGVVVAAAQADGPPGRSHSHPPGEEWIMRGGHRNSSGEWCCGDGDCFAVEPVRTTANGYLIMSIGETVPFSEAQPSQDGKYWRCKRPDGSRRCFFAPPPST